jgi:predicted nucleic acid-binding protein
MPDKPVVLNNTPLVALWALGRLDLLRDLFETDGNPGVLLLAKDAGLIESVAAWMSKLQEAGLFLSPGLVRKTLEIAGEEK